MTNRFFLAEHQGSRELRSSASRNYTHAAFNRFGVSFHEGRHNAPAGVPVVAVSELTKDEAAAYKKTKAAGQSLEFKRNRLVSLILDAGSEQRRAGKHMHALQLQTRGATYEDCIGEDAVAMFGYRHTGDLEAWLVGYQEKQAAAFKRLCLHRRALAKLDSGEE